VETSLQGALDRLVPEVREYATDQFVLRDDLRHLDAVYRAGAPEAVIFYCGRILEALAGAALQRIGLPPGSNVFANLQALEHLNRVGTATQHWAHALRRLGNLVRHIHGRVGPEDGALSLLFAEHWIDWFFREFSHGYRLPSVTGDREPFARGVAEEWRPLLRSLERLSASGAHPAAALPHAEAERHPAFRTKPVFPAVLAEILLGRGAYEEAFRVLHSGMAQFPDDLRLGQLLGLYWSRTNQLEKATAWLAPLYARHREDDETAGITAGVYKRQWLADRSGATLERSHRAYRDAWRASGRKNAYLGINAATTALWLDRREEARRLATAVAEVLHRRAAALPKDLNDPRGSIGFWDQVTLAEAQLILGDATAARETYRTALTLNADRRGDIEVSRRQLGELLKVLAVAPDVDSYLG
jgi:tetratricopeptide (TPR) repeat protein